MQGRGVAIMTPDLCERARIFASCVIAVAGVTGLAVCWVIAEQYEAAARRAQAQADAIRADAARREATRQARQGRP